MVQNKLLPFLLLTLFSCQLWAQQEYKPVFSYLEGEELIRKLQERYKPDEVLSYREARDLMYSKIDNLNDTITGVYSGFQIYVDPNQGPPDALYRRGHRDGINCEHLWPRNKGALDGLPYSDMHHLFPIRTRTNEARDNFPLGEVDDEKTERWFYYNFEQEPVPLDPIIDLYSELGEGKFEPREEFKGNAARAMFYFYTMYQDAALKADPAFFEIQKEDLLNWHEMDPVDSREYTRTMEIAKYQGGKPNPFILDPSLAKRAFFEE